ncbi:uncharacterized protein [Physcomitrium patens]|uniref:uncharacterized protein n=1 Tax=Physcomitrium patens TaxID=3218 RepID=UPI000D166213|nr:uncharacterized protein C4orf22 homolog [Physcomitrium patens]|eukprot:XP_024379106.1 uncharacterized protein C4orf22 homolog [Physcomitrella patens]
MEMAAASGRKPLKMGTKKEDFPAFTTTQGIAIVNEFQSYEDYLDSQITLTDLFYLEDLELARQLVEIGYRSNAEVMSRDDFAQYKVKAEAARQATIVKVPKKLFSAGKDVSGYPFLKALQDRERPIIEGKLCTVVFIRDYTKAGHEVSGYIDFAERMRTQDLKPVFLLKRKLLPEIYDLSYYNWTTNTSHTTSTSNWHVIAENENGMLLKNKIDRKVMSMDPKLPTPGDNSTRTVIKSGEYEQIVIYDHTTRRKL